MKLLYICFISVLFQLFRQLKRLRNCKYKGKT